MVLLVAHGGLDGLHNVACDLAQSVDLLGVGCRVGQRLLLGLGTDDALTVKTYVPASYDLGLFAPSGLNGTLWRPGPLDRWGDTQARARDP